MALKNPFPSEVRTLFLWNYACFWCTQNSWDALHHIKGRVSSSALNACPIHNQKCHLGNGLLNTFEVQTQLLEKTYNFLLENGYSLEHQDKNFMKQQRKHYLQFLDDRTYESNVG